MKYYTIQTKKYTKFGQVCTGTVPIREIEICSRIAHEMKTDVDEITLILSKNHVEVDDVITIPRDQYKEIV